MQRTHSKRKEHDNDSEPGSRIQSRTRNIVELCPPQEILLPDDILENKPHQEGRRRVDPRRRGELNGFANQIGVNILDANDLGRLLLHSQNGMGISAPNIIAYT